MDNLKFEKEMKTLKKAAVAAGILVAVLTLKTHAAEPARDIMKEKSVVACLYADLETALIEDYLATQKADGQEREIAVAVYDDEDRLIYSGSENTEKAKAFKLKADFLMEYDNTSYYRITGS